MTSMKKDALLFWGLIATLVLGIVLLALSADSYSVITDERGCQIQATDRNSVFEEDTYSVKTYCPVEDK